MRVMKLEKTIYAKAYYPVHKIVQASGWGDLMRQMRPKIDCFEVKDSTEAVRCCSAVLASGYRARFRTDLQGKIRVWRID